MYYRIYELNGGVTRKSYLYLEVCDRKPSKYYPNGGKYLKRKGPQHKINGPLDDTITEFKNHVDLSQYDKYRRQYGLFEIKLGSGMMVAVTDEHFNVIQLKGNDSEI
jgi:hypothetical protein